MKLKFRYLTGLLPLALLAPATAEVIYSNYQNIAIPTDFTGVTVNVAGGTINPFFGGVGVANNDLLQPIRTTASNLGTLRDFTVGSTIDASQLYLATGYGGSQDHLGSTFTAGQEGYLGFKLNGSNYGWMRVVFTANTSGEVNPVIKDWAYDNSGAILAPGNSVGKQTFSSNLTLGSGSIFEWELAATPADSGRGTSYDTVNVAGTLGGSDAIFRVVLDGSQNFSESFWDTNHTWTDIFKSADAGDNLSYQSIFSNVQYWNNNSGNLGMPTGQGGFTITGSSLVWTAVPEPTSMLAGLLLGAGWLRRRR